MTGVDVDAVVAGAGRLAARAESPEALLDGVKPLLVEALGVDGCLVYLVEANGDLVESGGRALHLPMGFGVIGRVAADQIPAVLVDDAPRNPLHRSLIGLADGQLVSRLCVPARSTAGQCPAVLAVHSLRPRRFTPAEVDLAQRVADLVGVRLELERARGALRDYERDWDALVAGAVTAQEAERRRVAGDLHDGVTQAIASLTFHLSAARLALEAGDLADVERQVQSARELADVAYAETRVAITGLHNPVLDDLGLAASLASMARAVPNLDVQVDADEERLPIHVETALFRIAQEAVQNVVKHAGASSATITMRVRGSSAVLQVVDDGEGFDAPGVVSAPPRGSGSAPQYGVSGMYERVQLLGGRLSITSVPGHGTTVEVTLALA